MSASVDLLERVPFLAALRREDLEALAAYVTRRQYRRGDIIFQKEDPGQSLFIVERGAVRISLPSPQGSDLTLAVLGQGDFFGDMSLLDGEPRSASAVAATEAHLLSLERADFLGLIRSRPEAALAVLGVIARRLRDTDEMASNLSFMDAGGRLAKKLLDLAAAHGVTRPDGLLLDLPITQEELANMIGVTRESANRSLSELRREGLVETEGRRFLIKDPEGLLRRCQ